MTPGVIKFGPLWNRVVLNPSQKLIRRRGRTLCKFEEVTGMRLREYINRDEVEQLLNLHPDVQKRHRDAELWVDTRNGSLCLEVLDQAGLLLEKGAEAAQLMGVPISTERVQLVTASRREESRPASGPAAATTNASSEPAA